MSNIPTPEKKRTSLLVMLTLLFFFWGLANNMTGTLLDTFTNVLDINGIQTFMIQSAFYIAYFLFAIPATYYIFKFSYKNGIVLGLVLYAIGAMLFFPAASLANYYFYLGALLIMAAGCTMLETIANPYIISLSANHDDGIRRLNLAQSFNPLGSMTGMFMSALFIRTTSSSLYLGGMDNTEIMHEELDTITMVYASIGEILLIITALMLFISIPVSPRLNAVIGELPNFSYSIQKLHKSRGFKGGVVALFFYVGAQTGVWGFMSDTIKSLGDEFAGISANTTMIITFVVFSVSRFIFTWLMKSYDWRKLLMVASVGAVLMCLLVQIDSGVFSFLALFMITAFMSMMFPTIFGAALENSGHSMQMGASLLIMAIVGGAVISPLQEFVASSLTPQMSYIIPMVCFMIIVGYSSYIIINSTRRG